MRKHNLRARVYKCGGHAKALQVLKQSACNEIDLQADLSLTKHEFNPVVTNVYKTWKRFMKYAIPSFGCYWVEIFINVQTTYTGIETTLLIANGKVIKEFSHVKK